MNIALIRRILRSIDENITLIYYLTLKQGYFFYILGKSDFIYKIIINKKYQSCNCEDYFKHKTLCKHICFVLFDLRKFSGEIGTRLIAHIFILHLNFSFKFQR